MSLPTFPIDPASLTRDDAINQIISSIAMEELGLSHILNAEGEKLQYLLGTLSGVSGPVGVTVDQILAANASVTSLLGAAADNQQALTDKLQSALSASVQTGPTGPTGPTGSSMLSGIQMQIISVPNKIINGNEAIIFDELITNTNSNISYDVTTGEFSILSPGSYVIHWWVNADGSTDPSGLAAVSIYVNGIHHSSAVTPTTTGYFAGQGLISINVVPSIVTIVNDTQYAFQLSWFPPVQGGILIYS